jgi:hypothetical protein
MRTLERYPKYPPQTLLAVAAVMVLVAGSLTGYFDSENRMHSAIRDPFRIGYQLERLRDAAMLLPEGAVIGYISDVPEQTPAGTLFFFAAQYALAPRLLVIFPPKRGVTVKWVLGNFSVTQDYVGFAKAHGLALVKECGPGVAIFQPELE